MLKSSVALLAVALVLALAEPRATAQGKPKLADYFANIPQTVLDPGYSPQATRSTWTEDLNGDGQQDVVVLGNNPPAPGTTLLQPAAGTRVPRGWQRTFRACGLCAFPR